MTTSSPESLFYDFVQLCLGMFCREWKNVWCQVAPSDLSLSGEMKLYGKVYYISVGLGYARDHTGEYTLQDLLCML